MSSQDIYFLTGEFTIIGIATIIGGILYYYHRLNRITFPVIFIAMVSIGIIWFGINYQLPSDIVIWWILFALSFGVGKFIVIKFWQRRIDERFKNRFRK